MISVTDVMSKATFETKIRSYLIFVSNAGNAVSVIFLAECKKIPEKKQENYCFGLRLCVFVVNLRTFRV